MKLKINGPRLDYENLYDNKVSHRKNCQRESNYIETSSMALRMDKTIGGGDVKKFIVEFMYGENEKRWPQGTIVLSTVLIHSNSEEKDIKTSKKIFTNDEDYPADHHFVRDLVKEIADLKKQRYKKEDLCVKVDLVQNYSPCNNSALAILKCQNDLRNKKIDIFWTITFANFFNHEEEENLKGLMKLLKNDAIELKLLQGQAEWLAFLSDEDFVDLSKDDKPSKTRLELFVKASSAKREKRENFDLGMMEILKVLKGNYDSENGENTFCIYTNTEKFKRCQAKSLISYSLDII